MTITILTLFPQMFTGPFDHSIIKRAQATKKVTIHFINIRNFALDRYKSVDDHPYGGGHGMIMRVDVIDRALSSIKGLTHKILLDPHGARYTQKKAKALSKLQHIVLVCGHYEGIDERSRSLVDEEISIGDYVLTGGEIPAMAIVDSVVRLIPGVLAKSEAVTQESFSLDPDYLEHPQYTRPARHESLSVPEVLLSGDHKKIAAWKKEKALRRKRVSLGNRSRTG